jgi:large subunit ribosomal protein L35
MAYKFKPNKSVAKRFSVTRTGKVKRHHSFTSHLMSARPSSKRRKLRRPAILAEGHARNMRKLMGVGGLHPNKIQHDRDLEAQAEAPETRPLTKAGKSRAARKSKIKSKSSAERK